MIRLDLISFITSTLLLFETDEKKHNESHVNKNHDSEDNWRQNKQYGMQLSKLSQIQLL